jgi:hypothetical protein
MFYFDMASIYELSIEELECLRSYLCLIDVEKINNILVYKRQESNDMAGGVIKDGEFIEDMSQTSLPSPPDINSVCGAAAIADLPIINTTNSSKVTEDKI